MTEDGYKRMDEAQADWSLGAQAAMKNFIDQQANMAQQSRAFVNDFTNGFADAFTQFATGTESAKKAFGSFID